MRSSLFLALIINVGFLIVGLSEGYKFNVGGKDGWVLNPSENYNHWAERNRFQINDTLFFKYKKGSDSVLVVNKEDYYSCNNSQPLESLAEGDSIFKFNRSGPFFFISGNADYCKKGQKLIVVVLALYHRGHRSPLLPLPPAPSPSSLPPSLPEDVPNSDPQAPSPPPSKSAAGLSLGGGSGSPVGLVVAIGASVMLGSFVGLV